MSTIAANWLCVAMFAATAAEDSIATTKAISAPVERSMRIDASSATVGFEIAALWILRRHGRFGQIEGSVDVAADGATARIAVRIGVDSVHMKDPDHVELLLSPAFFDAERHPWIEFRSDAFALSAAPHTALPGKLTVRGITRRVRFDLDLGSCRPGLPDACTVTVAGVLQRSRFGMTEYRRTLADKVNLTITATLGPASL